MYVRATNLYYYYYYNGPCTSVLVRMRVFKWFFVHTLMTDKRNYIGSLTRVNIVKHIGTLCEMCYMYTSVHVYRKRNERLYWLKGLWNAMLCMYTYFTKYPCFWAIQTKSNEVKKSSDDLVNVLLFVKVPCLSLTHEGAVSWDHELSVTSTLKVYKIKMSCWRKWSLHVYLN